MATVRTQREIRQKAPLWLIGLLLANVVIMAIDARDSQGQQKIVRVWTQTFASPIQNASSKAGGATTQEAIAAKCPMIINQVVPGQEEGNARLIAETKSAFIIMHMLGTPQTMQITPQYANVVSEIADFFRQQYARAIVYNIDPMAIAFDPGIGFGKTLEHNLELLAQLERLRACDRPIVIGVSRKSFLGKLINSAQVSDRLAPAVALTSLLRTRGADVLRVHDVKENVNALKVTEAILQRAK